ncbi:MAG: hypothetical protein E7609_04825 [Ruminococcaceae bacterium]|nr:hypothetical protein [Oscillospiraceae bacterium]
MTNYLSPNDPRFQADSDAVSIQNAIDAAEKGPIRTVRIPRVCERMGREEWIIDKSILLLSNITVILDDCHLTLKKDVYENIFRNKNMYTDVSTKREGKQTGIRIIGVGDAVLDGGEGNDLTEATSLKDGRPNIRFNNFILLHNVSNYVIENISCVNLRWWAINQICCTDGRLENIHFFNGKLTRNQDGIDLRIGCSNIYINNITGRCGDDVVALSAFKASKECEKFLVEGMTPDIHDVTIRNVCAHTHYSLVALRNTDGAKIYRVYIENIRDSGGEYGPINIVRIGENLYYRERTSILGETYDIRVRGVYSSTLCTVMLGGADLIVSAIGWIGHTAFIDPHTKAFKADTLEEFLEIKAGFVDNHRLTIQQNTGAGSLWGTPRYSVSIGPWDVIHAREHLERHDLQSVGGYASWERMISRLQLYGPVCIEVPASIYQLTKGTIYVSEEMARPIEPMDFYAL